MSNNLRPPRRPPTHRTDYSWLPYFIDREFSRYSRKTKHFGNRRQLNVIIFIKRWIEVYINSKSCNKQIGVIAKQKKKEKKKQGTIKMARQWRGAIRGFSLPPCGNSSFQNQGEYAAVESARWQRIKRLLDIRTGSPVRCRNSCINLRARGYTAGAMDAECVKACVITRYLCVQIPLSRLRGGEDGSPFYYGLTVAGGRGFEYGTGQTGKVNVSIPKDREED